MITRTEAAGSTLSLDLIKIELANITTVCKRFLNSGLKDIVPIVDSK